MNFEYLDSESEKTLLKFIKDENLTGERVCGSTVEYLINNEYILGKDVTTLTNASKQYMIQGVTQKGKSYFEMKEKHEKELRKYSHREWRIAIISALLGATVGLIPTIVRWIIK